MKVSKLAGEAGTGLDAVVDEEGSRVFRDRLEEEMQRDYDIIRSSSPTRSAKTKIFTISLPGHFMRPVSHDWNAIDVLKAPYRDAIVTFQSYPKALFGYPPRDLNERSQSPHNTQ